MSLCALFGQEREEPCPRCGGEAFYRGGNWNCGEIGAGCGWTTMRYDGVNQLTLERCPECSARIVYNGNYFCEYFDHYCNWALPHPPRKQADKDLLFWLTGERPRDRR